MSDNWKAAVLTLEEAGNGMHRLLDGSMGYFITHSFNIGAIAQWMDKWMEATDE